MQKVLNYQQVTWFSLVLNQILLYKKVKQMAWLGHFIHNSCYKDTSIRRRIETVCSDGNIACLCNSYKDTSIRRRIETYQKLYP